MNNREEQKSTTTSYTLGDDTPIKIDTGTAATVSDGDYTSGSIYFLNDTADVDQAVGDFSVDGVVVVSSGGSNDDFDNKTIASGESISVNGTVIGTVDAVSGNNGQNASDLQISFNNAATAANISTFLQNLYYAEAATATEPGDRSYQITITDSANVQATTVAFTLTGEAPTITSATYDITTGKVTITGNYIPADPNRNDINTTAFTFTGNGAQTHTLTDTATVERTSATSFEITLSATDKAAIDALFNCNGTTALDNTTYNIAAADNWATGVADTQQSDPDSTTNIDISIATVPVTVSNIPTPTITSATYNANTGALVVTATNLMAYPGAINDIDVTKFTFTGLNAGTFTLTANTSNVEITSATSFTITLGSTDKTSVNALLFQNGTEYATGSAYNLAAADNWTLGARASDNIADSTNAITVSGYNNAPTISGLPLSPQLISSAGQATALNDITVADNDGDSLTVTLTASNGTINNLIDANANVAGIQLIGSASYINNALADATFTATKAGTASIGISVTDGIVNNPVTSTYNINVNAAPSIVGLPANPQVVNIAQAADLDDFSVADADGGDIFTVTLTASNGTLGGVTDADANTAGIQLIGSAATINSALAAATFTATKAGTASIGISVSDGIISSPVTDTYNLSVNTAPTIAGIPASAHFITQVGQSVDVDDVTVADVDGDNLTVTLIATNGTLGGLTDADTNTAGIQLSGSAATINSALAAATFTATQAGAASVDVSVSDGIVSVPTTDTYSFAVNATPTLEAPTAISFNSAVYSINNVNIGPGSEYFRAISSADINGDGFKDLLAVNPNSETVYTLINNGDSTFAYGTEYTFPNPNNLTNHFGSGSIFGLKDIASADFNNDGRIDFATLNTKADASVTLFINGGNGAFSVANQYGITPGLGPIKITADDI